MCAIISTTIKCANMDTPLRVRNDGFIHCRILVELTGVRDFHKIREFPWFAATLASVAERLKLPEAALIDTFDRKSGAWVHPDVHGALVAAWTAHQAAIAASDAPPDRGVKRVHGGDSRVDLIEDFEFAAKITDAQTRLSASLCAKIKSRFASTMECYTLLLSQMEGNPHFDESQRQQIRAMMANAAASAASDLQTVERQCSVVDGAPGILGEQKGPQRLIEAAPVQVQSMLGITDYMLLKRKISIKESVSAAIGKTVAEHYRHTCQREPVKKEQQCSSGTRLVAVYAEPYWPLIDQAYAAYTQK